MNHTVIRLCAALLLIGLGLFWQKPAEASIQCSNVAMSALNFGNVDPLSTQPANSTATLTYTCTNSDPNDDYSAAICFSIGEPGGGPTSPRQMHSGANTLNFQLYQDSARSNVWGSQFFGSNTPLVARITVPQKYRGRNGTYDGSATLYGQVPPGQTTTIPGSYSDNYQNGDTAITINQVKGDTPPNDCSAAQQNGVAFPFNVTANVTKTCTVIAGTLDFGTPAGLLTSAVPGTSSISVQCYVGAAYDVGLDGGLNSGGNINARKMIRGANSVGYQLYRDAGRTQVWGNTVGSNTVTGIGDGNSRDFTVYGSVPAQPTPPAGTYIDTVVVSVTY